MNYDRVYEVYRWWVRSGPNGGNRDPANLAPRAAMGPEEQKLLLKLVDLGGTYQPAFDYREAQKRGAGAAELAQFAPDRNGLPGYAGRPVTLAEMVSAKDRGQDHIFLGAAGSDPFTSADTNGETVLGAEPTDTSDDRRLGGRPALAAGRRQGRRPGGRTALGGGTAVPRPPDVNIFGSPGGGFDPADGLAAALRARGRARRGGRQGTIIGGFGSGRPTTAPATLLGT